MNKPVVRVNDAWGHCVITADLDTADFAGKALISFGLLLGTKTHDSHTPGLVRFIVTNADDTPISAERVRAILKGVDGLDLHVDSP